MGCTTRTQRGATVCCLLGQQKKFCFRLLDLVHDGLAVLFHRHPETLRVVQRNPARVFLYIPVKRWANVKFITNSESGTVATSDTGELGSSAFSMEPISPARTYMRTSLFT